MALWTGWEVFTLTERCHLPGRGQHLPGVTTYNLKSHIYRYTAQSGFFELVQEVDTDGARDWRALTLEDVTNNDTN